MIKNNYPHNSNETADSQIIRLGSVATAHPPIATRQRETGDFLSRHFGQTINNRNLKILNTITTHPSIQRRRFALNTLEQLLHENPDKRIDRFTQWAIRLGEKAARKALAASQTLPNSISAIVVNTCTGYICPGLSTYLVEKLGLPRSTPAFDLVGSGCGGAIPNLQMSSSLLSDDSDKAVLSISVEICSATFQMSDDIGLIVSNALFADGAGACVLWRKPKGLALVSSATIHAPEHREAIRYIYRNGQLTNQLSQQLPSLLIKPVQNVVRRVLEQNRLQPRDVPHWAIHPGGAKIIETIRESLGLSEQQISITRSVLKEYGNTSSASVWFGLEKILNNGIKPGDWCIMLTAGAGLSAHALLLKA